MSRWQQVNWDSNLKGWQKQRMLKKTVQKSA